MIGKKIKYRLHPGSIVSPTDGDVHYIDGHKLARLYGVNIKECCWAGVYASCDLLKDLIDLYPLEHGGYREHLQKLQNGDEK